MTRGTSLNTIPPPEQSHHAGLPLRSASVFVSAARIVKNHPLRFLIVSVVVLVPCFWHRRIVASDLGSHLYNAWLAHLIVRGQAPELWIAHQFTNVLFDLLLSGFGSLFGLFAAEKIVVSFCVLIFFWGLFALMSAATKRPPWLLVPLIALFSYGWTFHLGLFNYYLSIGISFFCLAIFWRGSNRERLAILPLAVVIAMAHPFGLIWLVCACLYVLLMEWLPLRYQFLLLLATAGAILLVRYYLRHHYIVEAEPDPLYWFTGADQLILFGKRYGIVKWATISFAGVALAIDIIRRRRDPDLWKSYSIPLQLYIVVELGVLLFPRGVQFPHRVAIALITERLTSLSAAAACCVLGAMRPAKWHLGALLAIAALFVTFLYQDTATANRIEAQADALVRTLPPNQRVLASIFPLDDSRILIQHIIDRACIGHCFSYGNYEPGSEVFRVRATPRNPYVIPDYDTATDTEEGTYVVRPEDLPIYQVYQCTDTGTVLCIRPLRAGEQNNRLGVFDAD